jgi:hypothetical protein
MGEDEDEHEMMGCEWEVEVRDADGNLTDSKKGKNSLLVQMASIIGGAIDVSSAYPMGKYVPNSAMYGNLWNPSSGAAYSGFPVNEGAASAVAGIVVGTSNTPVTVDDYKIGTLIAHGVGAGQFQYLACTVNAVVTAAPRSSCRTDRTFTNNSGGSITVKEIAMYGRAYDASATYVICLCRDVIPDTPVANGSSMFVKYTIYVTT